MATEDEDEAGGLPIAIYLIVGVLAVIGLFTIIGTLFSAVAMIIKVGFYLLIAVAILWVLKSIFVGRSSTKRSKSDA